MRTSSIRPAMKFGKKEYTLYTPFFRPDPTRIIFSRTGIAMSHAFLGRITRPYSDISGLLISWSLECERMWVYEHEADEEVNRTHCHFLVVNCQKDFDTLKERKSWTNFGFKGNKDSSFKHYDPKYEYSKVTYMSKGNLDPVFSKNDNGIAAECKGKYVDYKKDRALQYIVEEKPKFNADEFYLACTLERESAPQNEAEEEEYSDYKKRLLKEAIKICQENKKMCHYRRITNMVQHVLCIKSPEMMFRKCLTMV